MGGACLRWRFGVADEGSGELLMAFLSEIGFDAFEILPYKRTSEVEESVEGSVKGSVVGSVPGKGEEKGDRNLGSKSQGNHAPSNGDAGNGQMVIEAYAIAEIVGTLARNWLPDVQDWILWVDGPHSMPDINWNAEWESNFEPVRLGHALGIRAPFHKPLDGVALELVIMPRMSFGTGHHETTLLMSWWLLGAIPDISIQIGDRVLGPCAFQNIDQLRIPLSIENLESHGSGVLLRGARVLDMGCGTGILGILAGRLGAASVVGIDVEDWSAENASENAARNGVPAPGTGAEWICGNAGHLPSITLDHGFFDLILANINRNVLLEDMPKYYDALAQGGQLWLSGFYTEDHEVLLREAGRLGLSCLGSASLNQWSTLLFEKRQSL
jgi:ribosomal protein L11 methyltransferase